MGDVLSRRRRFVVRFLVLTGLAACLFACGAILGIDDKPLRPDTDARALADATDAKDSGAEAQCNPRESAGCSADCPHDFCDDFDGDGQAPATRWTAPVGFKNPILQGDSGVALTTSGNSPPAALVVTTTSSGSTTFGILVNQLAFVDRHAGQAFDGVRVAVDLRIDALTFTGVGGPVKDAGSATMLGLLRPDSFPPKGIAVVLSANSVHLDVAEDVLGGGGAEAIAEINGGLNIANSLNNWVRVELFVGDQGRAVREGYETCKAIAPGLVAAASLGKIVGEACVAVPAGFGPASWAEHPALLIGGLLFAPGNAAFRIDNAVADFYVK